ncbi:MAG: ATP-grasp domain-containing protein [Phycisphaerales bacterium]
MSAHRIAIATCKGNPLAAGADEPLVRAFAEMDIDAKRVAWTDASADWATFDGVLVRSTWDWHLHPDRFGHWLTFAGKVTRVWNPPAQIAWSLDKHCLIDLASRGVRTVASSSIAGLEALRDFRSPWPDWVLKPALGATAYRTSRIRSDEDLAIWQRENKDFNGILIAQKFEPKVLEIGEVSLVFIGGEYSHAVRKVARAGDFRVQAEFGGTAEAIEASAADRVLADLCLSTVGVPLAFARIDLLHDESGEPILIECELAEPDLFFGECPEAARKLANVVAGFIPASR